jgi:hypothetical protein
MSVAPEPACMASSSINPISAVPASEIWRPSLVVSQALLPGFDGTEVGNVSLHKIRSAGVRSGNAMIEGTRIGVHDVIGLMQNGEMCPRT